jgi:hypothetical protein
MSSSEATIDMFFAEEEGIFRTGKRKKRKSGSHNAVRKPDYMSIRQLTHMRGRKEIASTTYNAVTEILGIETRARPSYNEEAGLIECVNRDQGHTAVAVDCRGYHATIYPEHCPGNVTEFDLLSRLADHGFKCDVQRYRKNRNKPPVALVECNPHKKTATVYPKSFVSQEAAQLWVQSLTGLGYQVQTRKAK